MAVTKLIRKWLGVSPCGEHPALRLAHPSQKPYSRDSFDLNPKSLRRWVADLPLANVGQTARRLFEALQKTNRMTVPVGQRLAFLEQVETPVAYVTDSLKKHYMGSSLPLSEHSAQVAKLSEALRRETALGYTLALRDMLAGRMRYGRRDRAAALLGALRHLGDVVVMNCCTYTPSAKGTWWHLHQLYLEAECCDVARVSVPTDGLTDAATPADSYVQSLMLALADPYHLSQNDIEAVHAALAQWASRVTVLPIARSEETGGFVVDLSRDEPPTPMPRPLESVPTCRLLDVSELVAAVREAAQGSGALPQPPISLGRETMMHLLRCWDQRPDRRAPRTDQRRPVRVVKGLASIRAHLAPVRSPLEPAGERDQEEPLARLGLPRTSPDLINLDTGEHPTPWGRAPSDAPRPVIQDCEIRDESPGGCRLRWVTAEGIGVKVGELVLVLDAGVSVGELRILGAVRWMRQLQGGGVETGIEWLAAEPAAADLQEVRGAVAQGRFRPGLALPSRGVGDNGMALIAEPVPFRVGDEVLITRGAAQARFRFVAVSEQTTCFAQYKIAPAERAEPGPAGHGTPRPKSDEFGRLWDTL